MFFPSAIALFAFATAAFAQTASNSTAIHPNGNTSKCLDVQAALFANGTPVQMYVPSVHAPPATCR